MKKHHVLPTAITTALVAVGALASSGSASAGFEPVIPGLGDPVIDTPAFPDACDNEQSLKFGWCLPDFVAEFDAVSPTVGKNGSGFIAARIRNEGMPTKAPVWSTISVEGSELIDVSMPGGTDVDFEIERSWFDADTYIVQIPGGLDTGEYAYVGLVFAEWTNIDVDIEANFHADAEDHDFLGLDDYQLDERNSTNNDDTYRFVTG